MSRDLADSRRWTRAGTALFLDAIAGFDDATLDAASGLPDWSRRQLVAHVAANARALMNLVSWARTGVVQPMYASPQAGVRGIADGAAKPSNQLLSWTRGCAHDLEQAMAELSAEQWGREVRTAQGRSVPASEIPWLRAREVFVHAVDLDAGATFADLPADFLVCLGADIVGKRNATPGIAVRLEATDVPVVWALAGPGRELEITAPLADLVAYLSGRARGGPTADRDDAPALSAWLGRNHSACCQSAAGGGPT